MATPTLEEFIKAVEVFTKTSDDDERDAADEWIQGLTKTVDAWGIADQCLQQEDIAPDVHFFAAQMMKMKIQMAFPEVPQESHVSLRDALCSSLGALAGASVKRIAVQLALALADLAIQMWEVWESPAEDLIAMFGQTPETVVGLLEFLKILPEEIGNPLLCLTHADRGEVASRYGQNCVSVIPFLESCIERYSGDSSIVERTFACLDSWLRFGGEVTIAFAHSPLLGACFEAVVEPDPTLRECACEAIVSAVYLGKSRHHPDLNPALVPRALELQPMFADAAAANDFGLAQSIARVLVEISESLVDPSLVTGDPSSEQLAAIEAMCTVASYDDTDTVLLTFGFWYSFATLIWDISTHIQDPDERDRFKDQFREYFKLLYECLLRLVRCEAEIEAILDRDEELSDFRERAADLVVETQFILGPEFAMGELLGACQSEGVGWNDIEAALYLMSCRLAFGLKPDSEVAPQLLEAISTIRADDHPQLRVTSVKLLGDLARWGSHHPEAIAKIWEILLHAVQEQTLRVPAIFSILRLCETARDRFTNLEELITFVEHCDEMDLNRADTNRLLRASAEVVSHQKPSDMTPAFGALVRPIVAKLQTDVEGDDSPVPALERLGEVFKWTNIPSASLKHVREHPLSEVCTEVFGTLKLVMEHFADNRIIIEEANRSVKHMLRSLDVHAHTIAGDILQLIVHLFQAHRHPSCLYVCTGIVRTFGRNEGLADDVLEVVQTLANPTFELLSSSADALVQNPELVDDLFRLLLQTLRTIPHAMYTEDLGLPAFQLGAATMLLRHRMAHETATEYLRQFIGMHRGIYLEDHEEERPRFLELSCQFIEAEGAKLVESCILAFIGELPQMYHADCADVLYEVHITAPEKCYRMVEAILQTERLSSSRATPAQLMEFLSNFDSDQKWDGVVDFREEVVKRFARIFTDYRTLDDGQ